MKLTGEDKSYLRELMKDYLKKIPDATLEEKAELRSWVMTGHSPYDNPDELCDDSCHPLDFISALRFWKDFCPELAENTDPDEEPILRNDLSSSTS